MPQHKLILIDGHSLAYRAFHALPADLTNSSGEFTNAIFGFALMLFTVLNEEQPDYAIVTFDKGPSFRVRKYAEYKAHREKMPDEMRGQMGRIREFVSALGIPIVELEDYEADDLLGTLSLQAAKADLDVIIVTGDRDALQLVDEHITVLTSGRRFSDTIYYTPDKVRERYGGLEPTQLIDLKAMMGDSSDNIPGVHGVGEKGGIKLLNKYGSLDKIYAHLDELATRYRNALEKGREAAYLSQYLGRIVRDAPVSLDLKTADFINGYDAERLMNFLQQLEFRSLLTRIPKPKGVPSVKATGQLSLFGADSAITGGEMQPLGDYHLVVDAVTLEKLVAGLSESPVFTLDTETTGTDPMVAELVGISLTDKAGMAWYIPVQSLPDEPVLALETVARHLGPLLADTSILKQGHNLKYDLKVLARHGMPCAGPFFDTMLAEWVLNPASPNLGLKNQAWSRLGVQMTEIKELIGSGKSQKTMDQVPLDKVVPYASADADMTHRLSGVLEAELKEREQFDLFRDIEMPLLPILLEMEMHGVRLDVAWLEALSQELTARLEQLDSDITRYAGVSFNINSTQQLSEVLFDRLGLPTRGVSKTKSGHYSTRASVLEDLQGAHPIVDAILDYRELAKLKSTYVDALPQLVNPATGRVHTSYNQTGTVTGRLSSANPNLQNIPIRSEEGRRVRRAFVSEEGWLLVGADYSQVELRVMAHVSEDEGLIMAFQKGEDIHATTAAAVYGVALEDVSYEMRRVAKAVNFGLIYGQTAYGLARQIGVQPDEADAFIARYFERFPRVHTYMDQMQREAAEKGYVETLLQRRRYFPELGPGSQVSKRGQQAALRMAINTPIQGTAADILKLAMLRLNAMLKECNQQARIILQVHDELVLEVPVGERDAVIATLREAMEGAFELRVPLKVDVEVGENWEEME
ncbi:MAG: DNA polymerase I [Anaerolineae bacterium]|nr:DNA polymerase I [Anaerolineae bacterium]